MGPSSNSKSVDVVGADGRRKLRNLGIVLLLAIIPWVAPGINYGSGVDDRKPRERLSDLVSMLKAGDRTCERFLELSGLASDAEIQDEVLETFEIELAIDPTALCPAVYHHKALMNAERYDDAGNAGIRVSKIGCSNVGIPCTAEDEAFLHLFSLMLQFDAAMPKFEEEGCSIEEFRMHDSTLETAIEIADSLTADYEPPEAWPGPGWIVHPALVARAAYAHCAWSDPAIDQTLSLWEDYFRLCPEYEPEEMCYQIYLVKVGWFRKKGLVIRWRPEGDIVGFDPELWRSTGPEGRFEMATKLVYSKILIGMTLQELQDLLGRPDELSEDEFNFKLRSRQSGDCYSLDVSLINSVVTHAHVYYDDFSCYYSLREGSEAP